MDGDLCALVFDGGGDNRVARGQGGDLTVIGDAGYLRIGGGPAEVGLGRGRVREANHVGDVSGVMVPEARVINQPVSAFTLMSDGCENTSWLHNQLNNATGRFYDPNTPHKGFFEPLFQKLQQYRAQGISENERAKEWYKFIKEGNQKFRDETDDKTMILGVLYI